MNAGVHQTEDGPSLLVGEAFRPGEIVYFSFQLSGYSQSPVKKVRLTYRVEAFDPKGVKIEEPAESIFDATLHDEDKHWVPKLRVPIAIPPVAPPGVYKITTLVTDDISHLTAKAETTFEVEGHEVPTSAELAIRNLTFHRSEEDVKALEEAVFRAGSPLYARFEISGFRYGAGNALNVYYDVAVVNPAGKQIYLQEHAAEDKTVSYYPKPFVPGQMSLELRPDMRQGEYTVVVVAHDEIGEQRVEARRTFRVE